MNNFEIDGFGDNITDEHERKAFLRATRNESGIENTEAGFKVFVERKRKKKTRLIFGRIGPEYEHISIINQLLRIQGSLLTVVYANCKYDFNVGGNVIEYIDTNYHVGKLVLSDYDYSIEDDTYIKVKDEGCQEPLSQTMDSLNVVLLDPWGKEILSSIQFVEYIEDCYFSDKYYYKSGGDDQLMHHMYYCKNINDLLEYIYHNYDDFYKIAKNINECDKGNEMKLRLIDYMLYIKGYCVHAIVEKYNQEIKSLIKEKTIRT